MKAEFAFLAGAFFFVAAADIEPTFRVFLSYPAEDTKISWKRSIFYIEEPIYRGVSEKKNLKDV